MSLLKVAFLGEKNAKTPKQSKPQKLKWKSYSQLYLSSEGARGRLVCTQRHWKGLQRLHKAPAEALLPQQVGHRLRPLWKKDTSEQSNIFFPLSPAPQQPPTALWLATLIFQNSTMLFCCYPIAAFTPSYSPQQLSSSEHPWESSFQSFYAVRLRLPCCPYSMLR